MPHDSSSTPFVPLRIASSRASYRRSVRLAHAIEIEIAVRRAADPHR